MRMLSELSASKKYYGLLAVFIVIYLFTIFIIETDSASLARYNIDATQLRLLSITIVIPVIGIWVAAVYSIIKVSDYSHRIKDGIDGEGFRYLANGMVILGLSFPVTSVVSRLLANGVRQDLIVQSTATIIHTHLSVLMKLAGFWLVFLGARSLLRSIKKAKIEKKHLITVIAALVIIGLVYLVVTFMNPSREVAIAPATNATYYTPDWITFATIVVPYIVTWSLGFFAALFLSSYYRNVVGKIYKKALLRLTQGFFIVILSSILLQFVTTASTSVQGWGIGAVMLTIYLLLAIIAVGHVLIAVGAKHLARLEEVT